jgi:plastocyanin
MRGLRLHVMVGLAALSVVAAACGSDANDASSGDAGSSGSSSTGSTGGSGASMGGGSLYGGGGGGRYGNSAEMTGATGDTGSSGGAKTDAKASVNNYLFMPATVKVNSGDTLEVTNGNARTPHTFTVVGEDVDLELAPLTSETTTIDLAPGTYQLICRFHEQLGMKGTLKVS